MGLHHLWLLAIDNWFLFYKNRARDLNQRPQTPQSVTLPTLPRADRVVCRIAIVKRWIRHGVASFVPLASRTWIYDDILSWSEFGWGRGVQSQWSGVGWPRLSGTSAGRVKEAKDDEAVWVDLGYRSYTAVTQIFANNNLVKTFQLTASIQMIKLQKVSIKHHINNNFRSDKIK